MLHTTGRSKAYHQYECAHGVASHCSLKILFHKPVICMVISSVWSVECGVWRVECGGWSRECGVWSVECGVWSLECEV